ncbi:MAG: aminotransferase class V-fold PLP-dependent enzyme, partial [Pseudomonadota bacterium]
HGFPNVAELGADIYLFSTYKTFGPHQGIMCIRRQLGLQLPNQGHDFIGDKPEKRFTPAGPDHAQVAACAGLSDYYDALYDKHFRAGRDAKGRAAQLHDLFRAHETRLLEPLLEYLRARNDVRLLGPGLAAHRTPTLSLVVQDNPQDLVSRLNAHGIMAGAGEFYAPRCLRALGVEPGHGVLRLSFVHYTSAEEVDRLIEALDHVL